MRYPWPVIIILLGLLGGGADAKVPLEPARPYQRSDYELAYDVFVKSGALQEALAVALKALRAEPNNQEWRRRAAQAALWQGATDIALKNYFYLALMGDPEASKQAMTLAKARKDYRKLLVLYKLQLQKRPDDHDLFWRYIETWSEVGRPEKAIPVIWQRYRRYRDGRLLRRLAEIYRNIDQPQRERAVLTTLLSHRPQRLWAVQKLVALELMQGNLDRAYAVLQSHVPQLAEVPPPLGQLHLELAWLQQDYQTFYELAQRHRQSVSADQIARLILLSSRQGKMADAFELALGLWRRSPDLQSALMLLSIAGDDDSGRLLDRAVAELAADIPGELRDHPLYFLSLARWHSQHGRWQQAQDIYRRALAQAPGHLETWLGYLWTYLDSGQAQALTPLLPTLQNWALHEPKLLEPTIALLTALDRPEQALIYARLALPQHRYDPAWLVNYSDLLEQAGNSQEAQLWRVYSWQLINKAPFATTERQQITLLRLLQILAGGDRSTAEMVRLMADSKTVAKPRHRDLVLAWSLSQSQDELARFWYFKAYWRQHQQPAWAALSQAMTRSDSQAIGQLLDHHASQLPRRDLVNAARQLHRDQWALTQAFVRWETAPADWQLASQFQDLALNQARQAKFFWRYENLQDAHWHQAHLEVSQQFTPRLRLTALFERLLTIDLDPNIWRGPPPHPARYLLATRYQSRFGSTRVSGGITQAQGQHPAFALEHRWPLWSNLNLGIKLATGDINRESLQLFLAGSAREVSANFNYAYRQRHDFFTQIGHRWFQAANGDQVGKGWLIDSSYRYLWRSKTPQVALRAGIQWRDYTASSKLPGRLARHVPVGGTRNGTFLVPPDYTQVNLALDFNTGFEEGFSPRIHPFLSVAGNWHSINGIGGSVRAGVSARVIGPDRLTLAFERIKGGQGVQNDTLNLGLTYQLFF